MQKSGLPVASLLAAVLACAGPAAATQEYILPTLLDVTGVEAGDVLSIRAAPSTRAEIIGMHDYDARDIEIVAHDRTGRWAHEFYQCSLALFHEMTRFFTLAPARGRRMKRALHWTVGPESRRRMTSWIGMAGRQWTGPMPGSGCPSPAAMMSLWIEIRQ